MDESKVVLVTGATDGIGRQAALALAALGHTVLVHGRNPERVREMEEEARAAGSEQARGFVADFASLKSVRALADELEQWAPRLQVLVNNAGVMMNERRITPDGHETTWQVNYLAPFLLTLRLVPLLERSAPARILNVSSMVHQSGELDFDDLEATRRYSGYGAYAQSKLALILFTRELAARLEGRGVSVNAMHPGVVATKLLHVAFGGMGGLSPDRAARSVVQLAVGAEVEGLTGRYFVHARESRPSATAQDPQLQRRLWEVSAKATGVG